MPEQGKPERDFEAVSERVTLEQLEARHQALDQAANQIRERPPTLNYPAPRPDDPGLVRPSGEAARLEQARLREQINRDLDEVRRQIQAEKSPGYLPDASPNQDRDRGR